LGDKAPNILLAGGGTGGHLYPALAIADEIRRLEPASRFLFLGTKGKIEARVVPERGYALRLIWISGFHRRLTIDNLLFPMSPNGALNHRKVGSQFWLDLSSQSKECLRAGDKHHRVPQPAASHQHASLLTRWFLDEPIDALDGPPAILNGC